MAQNSSHLPLEQYLPVVKQQGGIYSNLPVVLADSVTATDVIVTKATTAISGATAATLGNTGGATGPATAAQAAWLELSIGGSNYYLPLWQ